MTKYISKLPKKPYKNLNDFINKWNKTYEWKWRNRWDEIPVGRLICRQCGGAGEHYRLEDNDPIEGYKMAEKVSCEKCHGIGLEYKENTNKFYEAEISEWRQELEETKGIIARQKVLLKIIKDAGIRMKDIEWLMENSDV